MHKELARKINEQTITQEELEKFQEHIVEMILRTLPSTIEYLVKQSASMKQLSDKFFENNKDLANHKDLLSQVIEQTEAENPGLDYESLLSEAAKRARSRLGSLRETQKQPERKVNLEDLDRSLGEL